MSIIRPDVPIIGQPTQIVVRDIYIVAPNIVTVGSGGYDIGDAVVHLEVTSPLQSRQWRVPLTLEQCSHIDGELHRLVAGNTYKPSSGRTGNDDY